MEQEAKFTGASKHIANHYHLTRENVEQVDFGLKYVPSGKNLPDILTMGLCDKVYVKLSKRIGADLRMTDTSADE